MRVLPPQGIHTAARLHMNEVPQPVSPAVRRRVVDALDTLYRYPDEALKDATRRLAGYMGVEPAELVITNGVDEAVDAVLLSVGRAACVWPGFDGYGDRAQALGVPFRQLQLDDSWDLPRSGVALQADEALFASQPSNPTGGFFTDNRWADAVRAAGHLVFLDETYIDFANTGQSEPPPVLIRDRLITYRSFSKAYGLAGLRLGAMFGPADLLQRIRANMRFLSVGTLSLAALHGLMDDDASRALAVQRVKHNRARYAETLGARNDLFETVIAGAGNFVLAKPRRGSIPGGTLDIAHRAGVDVRDCTPFGLSGWLRITVGTDADLSLLLSLTVN